MLQDTSAILLAAGESKRFGANNKLLQGVNGKPILLSCVDTLLNSDVQNIVVITGHNQAAIEQALNAYQSEKLTSHFNPLFQQGQSSSLFAGIQQCKASSAILVCLADMPHVQTDTVNRILRSAHDNPDSAIVAPQFNEKRGNPVLFKQSVFNELLCIKGDMGAKHYIDQHPDLVTLVNVQDAGIHLDYDSALDFSRQLQP